ncbi:MAG: AAA family ATPase [Ruminobacter sp.]|nr:AAA family ATPase [Ruminobacter sp.]
MNNNHLYNTFHAALRELYASLKGNEAIKFLGITGVTKFNIITGFSGTDIIDVTFHSAVATLIGFTRAEITKYYIDYLNLGVSLEKSKPIEEVSNQDPKSRIISTQNNSTKQI